MKDIEDDSRLVALNTDFRAFRIFRDDNGKVHGAIVRQVISDLSYGDVIIRTAFAGINYKDALATTDYGNVIRRYPCIGGSDASGTVIASNHPSFKAGDEVMVFARGFGIEHDGGFSEYLRVPADWVTPLPNGMTLFEAAALGIAGYTSALAVHLLQEAGLQPGHGRVLVNGATGAVSSMAISMLAGLGFEVVAMSSKAGHTEHLRNLGAKEVINRDTFNDKGKPLETGLWAAVIDSLGGQQFSWLLRSLKPRGIIASIGNVAGNDISTNILPFILRGVRVIGVNVSYYLDRQDLIWSRLAGDLKLTDQQSNVRTIELDQLSEQIELMLKAKTSGRAVLALSPRE